MSTKGRSYEAKLFQIKTISNVTQKDATCTRIGIVVPKKAVKRAVDRNLVKRRVRDIYRKNKAAWPKEVDFIIYCRKAALEATYDELKAEMLQWGKVVPEQMSRWSAGGRGGRGGGGGRVGGGGRGGRGGRAGPGGLGRGGGGVGGGRGTGNSRSFSTEEGSSGDEDGMIDDSSS